MTGSIAYKLFVAGGAFYCFFTFAMFVQTSMTQATAVVF